MYFFALSWIDEELVNNVYNYQCPQVEETELDDENQFCIEVLNEEFDSKGHEVNVLKFRATHIGRKLMG